MYSNGFDLKTLSVHHNFSIYVIYCQYLYQKTRAYAQGSSEKKKELLHSGVAEKSVTAQSSHCYKHFSLIKGLKSLRFQALMLFFGCA